jgi:hypothetical protein
MPLSLSVDCQISVDRRFEGNGWIVLEASRLSGTGTRTGSLPVVRIRPIIHPLPPPLIFAFHPPLCFFYTRRRRWPPSCRLSRLSFDLTMISQQISNLHAYN